MDKLSNKPKPSFHLLSIISFDAAIHLHNICLLSKCFAEIPI